MQIVSWGDNLHEMSYPTFWKKNKKNISKCRLLNFLPWVLSVKRTYVLSFRFRACVSWEGRATLSCQNDLTWRSTSSSQHVNWHVYCDTFSFISFLALSSIQSCWTNSYLIWMDRADISNSNNSRFWNKVKKKKKTAAAAIIKRTLLLLQRH